MCAYRDVVRKRTYSSFSDCVVFCSFVLYFGLVCGRLIHIQKCVAQTKFNSELKVL